METRKSDLLLYEGKAKKIFKTVNDHILRMQYKDSLTAFNALKKGEFPGKGKLNCQISTLIFQYLKSKSISHHWIETPNENEMLVQKTEIIPLEVVVRNYVAGSLAKKLKKSEGERLSFAVVEFYFKNDDLGDPFVNEDQILAFNWSTKDDLQFLKQQAIEINQALVELFSKANINLVDFKIEFGKNNQEQIILSDEISPDCMRLWDRSTGEKLDKDRFRHDLGNVQEAYQEIYNRLKKEVVCV